MDQLGRSLMTTSNVVRLMSCVFATADYCRRPCSLRCCLRHLAWAAWRARGFGSQGTTKSGLGLDSLRGAQTALMANQLRRAPQSGYYWRFVMASPFDEATRSAVPRRRWNGSFQVWRWLAS